MYKTEEEEHAKAKANAGAIALSKCCYVSPRNDEDRSASFIVVTAAVSA